MVGSPYLVWLVTAVATLSASLYPLATYLTVEVAAHDVDPWWWATAFTLSQGVALGLLLYLTRRRRLGADREKPFTVRDFRAAAVPRSGGWVAVLFAPVVWMVLARLSFALLAWATKLAGAAVAGPIEAMWPVALVAVLVAAGVAARPRHAVTLTAIAVGGVALVAAGRAGGWGVLAGSATGARVLVGGVLAAVGSALSGVAVGANIVYAYRLIGRVAPPLDRWARAWWSGWTLLVGVLGAVPLLAGVALLRSPVDVGALVGTVLYGATFGMMTAAATRVANAIDSSAAANSLLLLAMPLGVLWLLLVGVEILRLDLYLAGVAALLVVTAAAGRTVEQATFLNARQRPRRVADR